MAALIAPGNLARTSNTGGAPKPEIENIVAPDFRPDGSALAIVRYLLIIPDGASFAFDYRLRLSDL